MDTVRPWASKSGLTPVCSFPVVSGALPGVNAPVPSPDLAGTSGDPAPAASDLSVTLGVPLAAPTSPPFRASRSLLG